MRLLLVTGGVRSGKSRYAKEYARALGGDAVTFVATAQPVDDEMRRRIASHRAERPPAWFTVEAPSDAGLAVRQARTEVVLLDCLTLLLTHALIRAGPKDEQAALLAMRPEAERLLEACAARAGDLIVVTNEVGWGVHPESRLGRWFRDGLGIANQMLAAAAEDVVLLVSGVSVTIKQGQRAGP